MEERAGIRLEGDAKGFTAAAREAEAAAARLNTTVQANALHMERAGLSAKQYQQAMRQVGPQITDIVTQLAAGQNPMLVMIQQGGQLKDMFGGMVPAAKALVGSITPLTATLGGAGAALAVVTIISHQVAEEQKALQRALLDTNDAAGVTSEQMRNMARDVGAAVATQAKAVETVASLAGSGRIGGADLQRFTDLAIRGERTLGIAVADTVKIFSELGRDPVNASLRLNETTNYLTASIMEQIRALKSQGRDAEAASVAQNAWGNQMQRSTAQVEKGLGTLEKSWRAIKEGAAAAWDAMLNIGRPETVEDQIKRIDETLKSPLLRKARRQELINQREFLRQQLYQEGEAAAINAAANETTKNKLKEQEEAFQSLRVAQVKAGNAKMLAEINLGLQRAEDYTRTAYQRFELDAETANESLIAIERQKYDAQIAMIDKLAAAEKARKPTGDENKDKQNALAQLVLEQQRLDLLRGRAKLEAEISRGEFPNLKPRDVTEGAQTGLRIADIASDPATNKAATDFWLQQRSQAIAAGKEIEATNRQLSVALIRDDQERGRAQIALEEKVLRERLNLQYLSVDERKKAEDDLAEWRVLREKQLTEQLKPEWQRQVERWGDATRLMKDTFDETISAALREGENQWIRFAMTGKFSVRELGQAIEQEVARYAFKKFVSVMFNLLGNLGGVEGATGDFARMDRATVGHAGGVFGRDAMDGGRWMPSSMFAGAPRFHMGRLAFDEMPAVVKKEESILTPAQMRMLAPAGSANVVVNVINQTGAPVQATKQRNADGGLDVILTAMEEGMADHVASGTGPLGRAMENRYGLRPALV